MRHEAVDGMISCVIGAIGTGEYFVILSSIDLGSRMKVGNVTRLKSAPGRSWEMMCERTEEGRLSSVKVWAQGCCGHKG